MRWLFLTEGRDVPASRYRVEQFIPYFEREGITCQVKTVRPNVYISGWGRRRFSREWSRRLKLVTLWQLMQRFWAFPHLFFADAVIIQRPLLGISSAFLEQWIARLKFPVIFDLDDAIYYHPDPETAGLLASKVEKILRACTAATCGNSYLRDYAGRYTRAHLVPTSVDTDRIKPRRQPPSGRKVCIGWVGLSGNFPYFSELEPVFLKIIKRYAQVEFVVISDAPYRPLHAGLPVTSLTWSREKEIERLHQLDIGIMPLPDTPWSKGKCGAKLVDYSAAGIASVSGDSVAARDIVVAGETGLIARTPEEWYRHLAYLVEHPRERAQMGLQARQRVQEHYSVQANYPRLMDIYRRAAERA